MLLERMESRDLQLQRRLQRVGMIGFLTRLHSEAFFTRLEGVSDGIIDIRLMETDRVTKDVLRVRSLKRQQHDRQWHEIQIKPNGGIALAS